MNPLHHDAIERRLALPLHEGPDRGLFGDAPEADLVRAPRESCGWELPVAPTLSRFAAPTADELALMRRFDPRRYFLGA